MTKKNDKLKRVLLIASVAALVILAFLLGQRTQVPAKKKTQVKKRTVEVMAAKKKAAVVVPAIPKRPRPKARVAIVIDDFGNNKNNLDALLALGEPVTLSVLPNLRYSREISTEAEEHGHEVILHLPLASHRSDVREEIDTLKPGMSESEVSSRLAKDINSIPGLKGVSNHMGSLATEDKMLMAKIFSYLKKRNLYFFDSLTSEKSVCREAAKDAGIRFAKRDAFLDNVNTVEAIEAELHRLEAMALRRGYATAVCHDRKNTMIALGRAMPEMRKDGIEFIYLSELVK